MDKLILIAFLIASTLLSFGQEIDDMDTSHVVPGLNKSWIAKNPTLANQRICICCKQRRDTSELLLFIVNDSLVTNHFQQFILNPYAIEKIDILDKEKAIKHFGQRAKYGAMLIKVNDSIKLVGLTYLLDHFSVKPENRNLPICLDGDFVTDPTNIKADITAIKSVDVTEGKYWFYTTQLASSQRFINIVTK